MGVTLDMMGMKVQPLELVNVLSVTVVLKYYQKRNSGNYGKQGVTPLINKCAECDSDNKK